MMKASFDRALRYDVRIACVTPLCHGGTESVEDGVLRYHDGTSFLQGTSLVGAFRRWRDDPALFGVRQEASPLIVSDLVFESDEVAIRPHLKLDPATGAPATKGFLTAAMAVGTQGSFRLTWRGTGDWKIAAQTIEAYLSALEGGLIRLGAKKNNDFGRVTVLDLRRKVYDMTDPEDRRDWLEDAPPVERLLVEPLRAEAVVFDILADFEILRTKAAQWQTSGEKSYVRATPIRENGRSVIPSSSIKGAMRVQMVRIAAQFGMEDRIGEILGMPGYSGRIAFSDGSFEGAEQERLHKRIRINRLTGGMLGSLVTTGKTTGGQLHWQIRVPDCGPCDCALVLFALRDLGLGLYTLGDGYALGWGRAENLRVTVHSPRGMATMRCDDGAVTLEDPTGMTKDWMQALGGMER